MTSATIPKDRLSARIATVEQHIRLENEHDLEGVLRTFGDTAQYDDEPWGEHYEGRNGVRLFYEQLMRAPAEEKSLDASENANPAGMAILQRAAYPSAPAKVSRLDRLNQSRISLFRFPEPCLDVIFNYSGYGKYRLVT
jgi:hypothetical protein